MRRSAAATAAGLRMRERLHLLCVLPLEGLHLFRVLSLKFLLLRKMLPLLGHLYPRRLLAHERLRLLLMPPDEFRRLLLVTALDSLPITAGAFLPFPALRRPWCAADIPASAGARTPPFPHHAFAEAAAIARPAFARGVLLLLGTGALELLQLDVVMIAL